MTSSLRSESSLQRSCGSGRTVKYAVWTRENDFDDAHKRRQGWKRRKSSGCGGSRLKRVRDIEDGNMAMTTDMEAVRFNVETRNGATGR
jgi:hypothetical protein